MRRRDAVAEAAASVAGEPPAHLLTMAGVAHFRPQADAEQLPDWVQGSEVEWWRRGTAMHLWSQARRKWCTDNGLDFVATFYPRWLRRRR